MDDGRWTLTHSRPTAVHPAGKSCAFVQTALQPSAVLNDVNFSALRAFLRSECGAEFLLGHVWLFC